MLSTSDLLNRALQHHQAGQVTEAEQLYRQLLEQQPNAVDALNFLGALLHQQGRFAEALTCFERVLAQQPNIPDAHNSVAIALRGQGKLAEAIEHYRQALELQPDHPEVLNNLANALRESGQLEAAIDAYERSLTLKPNYPEAHNNLGAALKDLGQLEEAIPHYREAMLLKPNYPEAHHNLGVALQRQGQVEAAIVYYRQAIALKPNFPEAHNSWGHALQQQGNYEEAIVQHQQAIDLKPDFAEAHHSLANALQLHNQLEAAIAAYQQALAIRPDYPEALNNLGNAYQEFGQPEQAIAQYQKALEFRPNFAEAYSNLGALLKDQRKLDEAIAYFQKAIELRPDYAEVHNNLGNAYQEQNKLDEAIACYRRALEINPELAETHSNLGNMLQQYGEFEVAFDHFQQAIRIQPDFAGAHNNLGIALRNCNRIEEALAAYDRAIELKPEFVEAHWNKALTYLLAGDLEQGFARYEWRFQWSKFQEQNPPRPLPGDRWDGSPLNGKTIFLYTEQGMGDAIQFIRYVPIVVQQGGRVVVECHPPLVNLFQRMPEIAEVIPYGKPLPAFDVHAPLMSLPFILGTTMATIPADVPYLGDGGIEGDRGVEGDGEGQGDKEVVGSKFKIGLVWNGNPQNPYNRSRAVPLAKLLALTELPQVQLYSLQKEIQPADLELLQAHPEIQDLREQLLDFVDTAAWMQQLDLVISVDTAVTHLAGALGQPVWLLLPFAPDWRWLLDRDDSPWYPTMRLFRQPSYGDWDSAIEQMQRALLQKLGQEGDEGGKGDKGGKEERKRLVPVSRQGKPFPKQQLSRQSPAIAPHAASRSPHSSPASPSSLASPSSPPSSSSPPAPPPLPTTLKAAIREHQAGRVREAEVLCQQLVAEQPEQADAWHLLGLIAHQERRLEEAIAHYRRVLMLNPNHHDTYNNLAVAFHEQGRLDEAMPYYEKGLALKPDYADAHNNYANALREKKREAEALHHYQQAISLRPNYADAYNNLGLLLFSQEKYQEATECYRQAVELRPEFSAAHNHLGNALKELGDFEGAIQHYQQAIALNPNNAKAYNNWGNVFRDQGDLQTAIQHYERATAIDPQFPEGHWNKALTFLLGGDLKRGFAEYEWRWHVKLPTFQSLRSFPGELWDGSPLQGKTIFLHAEQGMGDLLQFVRYVAIVAKLGGRVILECHQPLIHLIQQLPDVQQVIPYGSPPPAYDVQAPLLSLPHILGTTLETVPADVPYLWIGDRLGGEGVKAGEGDEGERTFTPVLPGLTQARLKVGMVWSGNPENPYNRSRAVPLSLLLTLAELPGIQLYSLQKDPTATDLELLQAHSEVIDLRHHLNDFVNTATLIQQLDVMISVDTAVTHLTGGLGRPIWLLLPFAPDWRWMLDRTDSPWYPTMRIFRQPTYGDWERAIAQVKTALVQEMKVGEGRGGKEDEGGRGGKEDEEGRGGKEDEGGKGDRAGNDRLVEGLDQRKGNKHQKRQKSRQPQPASSSSSSSSPSSSPSSSSPPSSPSPPLSTTLQTALQHYQQGNLQEAERLYRQVLQQDPDQVEALHAIGVIVCQAGQLETAENYLRRAVTLLPQFAQAWGNLGGVVQQRGRVEEAIGYYQHAIALDPLYADAHQNLAVALQEQERLEEAIVHCQQAIALKPQIADLYYNLGFMLRRLNRLDEAIVQYRQAIQRRPDFVEAHKNLGHALLLQGKFPEGFAEYEWRWQQQHWSRRPFTQPEWDGSPLNGKTILLHAEQGFGDTIQFVRYAALVRDHGGRVVVEAQSALLRLLETAPGIDQLVAQDTPLPEFDVHAPLLSLPRILGTTLDTVPAPIPYLHTSSSSPHLPISSSASSLKVGIAWMGNPNHKNNRYRSCNLADFQPLFDLPGTEFYSLQKGEAEAELRSTPDLPVQDLSPDLKDFADTAAAIAQLDLILTIDTSVAHLAGALGKPVWLLLSFAPDWRWMIDRDDSPWYPTMRLFRQTAPGDWASVFDRVKPALITQTNHLTPPSPSSLLSSPPPLLHLTPPPSLFATLPASIGIDWQINGTTEWGILGTHLILQLLQDQQSKPTLLVNAYLESLPPLYQARLRSLTSTTLDAHSCLVQRLDHTGTIAPSSSANSQHTRRIGVVMFTDTDWSSDAIAIAKDFDHLITCSTWNADILKQLGLSQVEIMLWGIDPSVLHPAPKSTLFGDRFVIFSGGDLSYANGQDITIAAFKVFQARHPEALLLTSWSYSEAMMGLNQAGHILDLPQVGVDGRLAVSDWLISNGVTADAAIDLGALPYASLGQVLCAADVALFPSRCQATSNPFAIAAMACGIPTILSANTGHLDLIRHNLGYPLRSQTAVKSPVAGVGTEGWGESNVEEVVETLERIYRDRQEAQDRARSAVEFLRDWTWEQQGHHWIKLFHQ